MTESKITQTEGMIPGLRRTIVNEDGTATVIEGRKQPIDLLSLVPVSSSFVGGDQLPAQAKKAEDEGDPIIPLVKAWYSAFRKQYELPYPGDYMTEWGRIRSLHTKGYTAEQIEGMMRIYWTDPTFLNYDKTVLDFIKATPKIVTLMIRRKRG